MVMRRPGLHRTRMPPTRGPSLRRCFALLSHQWQLRTEAEW